MQAVNATEAMPQRHESGRAGAATGRHQSFAVLSECRTEIMGIAILWVFLYHSWVTFPSLGPLRLLRTVRDAGYGGADIFLFLSGFGLMWGWTRAKPRLGDFYRRRFVRILPEYWIVAAVVIAVESVLSHHFLGDKLILTLTTLAFWLGREPPFDWYISSLIVLYAVFPLLATGMRRCNGHAGVVAAICGALLVVSVLLDGSRFGHLIILVSRIPVFIVGVYAGFMASSRDAPLRTGHILLCLVCVTASSLVLQAVFSLYPDKGERAGSVVVYLPFLLGIPPLCVLLAAAVATISRGVVGRYGMLVRQGLRALGSYSLEIFLIHIWVCSIGRRLDFDAGSWPNKGRFLEYACYFLITLMLAPALRLAARSVLPRDGNAIGRA